MKQKRSEPLRTFAKNNSTVLVLYFFLLLIAIGFIMNYDKISVHLFLNQFVGQSTFNSFFYYITYLGDGIVAIVLLLILLMVNVRLGIYASLSFLSASLFSQFLKRYLFSDVDRPWFIFQQKKELALRLVEGVDTHVYNSFPSGHATQVFAIFMCVIFFSKNKSLKLFFFFLSLLAAYSRVYISQHWLNDIVAGSIIGFSFSLFFYFLIIAKNKIPQLNTSLFSIKKNAGHQK